MENKSGYDDISPIDMIMQACFLRSKIGEQVIIVAFPVFLVYHRFCRRFFARFYLNFTYIFPAVRAVNISKTDQFPKQGLIIGKIRIMPVFKA